MIARDPSWSSVARAGAAATLLFAVGAAVTASAAPVTERISGPDSYAIIVGYNGGGVGLPVLHYADDDAVRFSMLFRGLNTSARPSKVWLLTDIDTQTAADLVTAGLPLSADGPPTRASLQAAIAAIAQALATRPRPTAPAILYVIYAGHGLRGRILLKPEGSSEAAITGHEIRAAIAALTHVTPSLRTLLFIDACRSQSLFTERGGDREIGPDLSAQISDLEERAGAVQIGILTAAASGKPAGEVTDLGAGYFSHVLASGLAGAADSDGDDVISFAELVAFVAFNTERLTGQRPWFTPPGGDLASVVIDHRGRATRLDFSAAPAGRYLVEAAPGRPVFVEAFKGDHRPLRLALPAGRYRVLRIVADDRARLAQIQLMDGQQLDLGGTVWGNPLVLSATLARGEAASTGAEASTSAPGNPQGAPGEERSLLGAAAAGAGGASLAFSAPFTPEVVSTLTAGYDAGRIPAITLERATNNIGLAFIAGAPPLGLDGTEGGLALRYRRSFGAFILGARTEWARSSYTAATTFDLDCYTALIEGGPRWQVGRRFDLAALAAAGAARVVRRGSDGRISGDPLAPTVAAAFSLDARVTNRWRVFGQVRYQAQWIRVDGERGASRGPSGEAGVAFGF